jgi:hypothetical protein
MAQPGPIVPKTLEEARQFGIPIVRPIRSSHFEFQLRRSTLPNSQLTNDARRHLFMDALYLQNEVTKGKLQKLQDNESLGNSTHLKYDATRIAAHYEVDVRTVERLVKQGNTENSLDMKDRSGRPKSLTPRKVRFPTR